jgi:hypothetical protein
MHALVTWKASSLQDAKQSLGKLETSTNTLAEDVINMLGAHDAKRCTQYQEPLDWENKARQLIGLLAGITAMWRTQGFTNQSTLLLEFKEKRSYKLRP